MKKFMAAVAAAAALATSGAALAQVAASNADKTFTIQKPAKSPNIEEQKIPGAQYREYVVGPGSEECWIREIPRAQTAANTIMDINHSWTSPLAPDKWVLLTKDNRLMGGVSTVKESAVNTAGDFPIQTAVLQGKEQEVYAALQARPGVEFWTFCTAYENAAARKAALQEISTSLTTAKDAEYKAQVEAAKAAAAAAAAAEAEKGDKGKKKKD